MNIAEINTYPKIARTLFSQARLQVENGFSISKSFRQLNILPIIVFNMLKVAENSGNISDNLSHIVGYLEHNLEQNLNDFIKKSGIFVMLVIASILLLIVSSVFLPLYDGMFEL